MNADIKIPEGTPKRKYGKYGVEFPLFFGHKYQLFREGEIVKIPINIYKKGKIYCMPGDLLIDLTDDEAFFFPINLSANWGDK